MKNKLLFITILIVATLVPIAVYDYTHVSKEEFAEMLRNHPIQQRLHMTRIERKSNGIPPNQYLDREYLLEMDPSTGEVRTENIEAVKSLNQKITKLYKVPGQDSENPWTERGPNNVGGRTRVIFYDPNDLTHQRVFAGGVSGGLWVNEDISDTNSSWTRVGIDENLAISSITVDPNDSYTWYAATGEAYVDNVSGNGLWKTTNGGATWTNILGVNFSDSEINRPYIINKVLAWDNNGSTEIFISIDGVYDFNFIGYQLSGWWRSTNGGNSFNKITFNTSSSDPYVFSDIEVTPDNAIWVATKSNLWGNGGGKIFKSTNGQTFTEKYSFTNGDRVEITVSNQDSNKIYALAETTTGVAMVKTTNGFATSTNMSLPNDADTDIPANDFTRGQAFYDLLLQVDPTDDNILYAGGIDLFRSTNAGTSWSQITKWSNNNNLANLNVSLVHADMHTLVFNPNNTNSAVLGNDGGIYYCADLAASSNSTNTITERNSGYNITQFYSGALGLYNGKDVLLGGAQDNGSLFAQNTLSGKNNFQDIYGGDGAKVFLDKDGDYAIISYVYNVYSTQPLPFTSTNTQKVIAEDQTTGDFINAADLDENLDILYTNSSSGGNYEIAKFKNLKTSPTRTNFTNVKLTSSPTVLKISPYTTDSSKLYIGTETGEILKVSFADTNTPIWTNLDINHQINTGAISDINFGSNENEIMVTYHNYGINNIYYTTNGGITWTAKDGDFPDIPVKAILMNPLTPDQVIIGTNLGIWKTGNFSSSSPSWTQSTNGMTNVKVTSLEYRSSDHKVLASTYGRGLFTSYFTEGQLDTIPINKDSYQIISKINNGQIVINSDNLVNDTVLLVVSDVKGKIIVNKNITFTNNSFTLNIQVQPGVYFFKMYSNNGLTTSKVLLY